jgi:hypothetical protein
LLPFHKRTIQENLHAKEKQANRWLRGALTPVLHNIAAATAAAQCSA